MSIFAENVVQKKSHAVESIYDNKNNTASLSTSNLETRWKALV